MDFHLQLDVLAQFTDLRARPLQMLRESVQLSGKEIGIGTALGRLGAERAAQRAKHDRAAQDYGFASNWGHQRTLSEVVDRLLLPRLVSS